MPKELFSYAVNTNIEHTRFLIKQRHYIIITFHVSDLGAC